MGGFTKGIILAFVAVVMLISYLAATQGWGVAPLRNPNIAKRSQQERDSLGRSGSSKGGGAYIFHSPGGGFRNSGSRNSGIRAGGSGGGGSSSRSFRSGSSAGRGK